MLQTLFTIGPFPIHTYGLVMAISFIVGIIIASKRARQAGEKPEFISDLALVVIITGIIGGRLCYVLINWQDFKDNLLSIVNPVQADGTVGIGGLVLIGGVILATISGALYVFLKKKSVLKFGDIVMPPLAICIGIGRIGCLLNGCCFGKASNLPWAISFPSDCPAGYYQAANHIENLHPTQAYMMLDGILIGLLLMYLERYKRFNGHSFFLFFILFGIERIIIDFFRYYPPSELHYGFTHNQWILGIAVIVFGVLFVKKWRRAVLPGRNP